MTISFKLKACDLPNLVLQVRPHLIEAVKHPLGAYDVSSKKISASTTVLQYWSQSDCPDEVGIAYALWDKYLLDTPSLSLKRYTRSSALDWLSNFQPDYLRNFENAVHPAMEADIFRVAYAMTESMVWIDSDHVPSTTKINNRFNSIDFSRWASHSHSSFLLKNWLKGTPFINNSIFRSGPACPVIRGVAQFILENDSSFFDTPDLIASYAGPKAYTRIASTFLSVMDTISLDISDDRQIKIFDDNNNILFELGNLFLFLGSRSDYLGEFSGDEWSYKSNPLLNWQMYNK